MWILIITVIWIGSDATSVGTIESIPNIHSHETCLSLAEHIIKTHNKDFKYITTSCYEVKGEQK